MADDDNLNTAPDASDLDVPADVGEDRPQALASIPGDGVFDMGGPSAAVANPFDTFDKPQGYQAPKTSTDSNPFDVFDKAPDRAAQRGLALLPEFSILKEAYRARDLTQKINDSISRDDLASQARRSAATLDPDGQKAWVDWEAGESKSEVDKWQRELRTLADEHGGLESVPPSANLPRIMEALQKAQTRHALAGQMQDDAALGVSRTHSPQMQAATALAIEEQERRLSYQQDVLAQVISGPVSDPIMLENAKANVQFERAKLEKLRAMQSGGQQWPAMKGATGTGEFIRQFGVGALATAPEALGGAAIRVGQDMGPGAGEALDAIGQVVRDFGKQMRRDTPAEASPNLLDLDWQKKGFFGDLKLYLAAKLGQGLGTSSVVLGTAATGGLPAAGATSVAMGVGQMQNAVEEAFALQGLDIPPDKVAYNVYLLGAGIGVLESVTELWALKGLMGAGKDVATKSLAASLAKGVAKGAAIEGITEGIQELLEIHGVADATGQSIDWQEARRRIIEATAAGAVPGAAMGGITARKPPSGGQKEPPPRVEPTMEPAAQAASSEPTAQPEQAPALPQTPEIAPGSGAQSTETQATPDAASSDILRQDATSATTTEAPTPEAPAAEPSPEEVTAQKALTAYLDSQGSLARSELPAMAAKLGVTPEELPKLLEKAVADGVLRKTAGGQYRRALPSADATYKMGSPEAARAAIEQAVGEISKALPKGTKVKVIDTVEGLPAKARGQAKAEEAKGGRVDAATVDGDIYLMSKALNPQGLLGHEGWHAVEARGLATRAERKVLAARAAKLPGLFDRQRYESAYAGRANLADLLEEEAAAHMVEARINGDDFGREINGILDRIIQFLERLANALAGKGFQTVDDVIYAFLSGEIARRQAVQDFMQANDVTAMATDGQTMFAFAGERAKTADLDKLARAKLMDAAGTGRDAIWTETGWFKGVDNKWRFEIDDSQATFAPDSPNPRSSSLMQRLDAMGSFDLQGMGLRGEDAAFLHEMYAAAYPKTNDLEIGYATGKGQRQGYYTRGHVEITYTGAKHPLDTLVHELQHDAQDREGFAPGASGRGMSMDDYKRVAGEVEARAVEVRRQMTPEQRAARPPWLDYDVPEDQQIVRFADGKHVSQMSYSEEPPVSGFPTLRSTAMYAIKAFHGSPHDFDRFSLDKIGTGEGAQAYGHGLYFAENEGVAKSYRDALSRSANSTKYTVDGNPVSVADTVGFEAAKLAYANGGVDQALSALRQQRSSKPAVYYHALERKLSEMKEQGSSVTKSDDPGRMYEVRINAEPEQFLDWDKPLYRQSEHVQSALQKAGVDVGPRNKWTVRETPSGNWSLRNVYGEHTATYKDRAKAEAAASEKTDNWHSGSTQLAYTKLGGNAIYSGLDKGAASAKLRDAGIPGIRYLDQGSRGEGQGTYNFVVFDDKLIEITAKDGVPISAADKSEVMFALRGLDPSPEARKARAEEMGFDTSKVWYHGTRKEFEAFSLGAAKNKNEVGIFLTQDARVASAYAGYYEDLMPGGYKAHEDESGTVLPLYLKKSMRIKTVDFEGGKYGRGDAIKSATSEGYDGVLLKNHYDAGGVQDQLVIFDPKNIRSVNAMFDPEKSDSANLMFALRDRLGFARQSPELRSMNALVRDLAFDLGIIVRRGLKTTPAKIAKSAAKQAGLELKGFYDPTTGVLRLARFNDIATFAEAAGNILSERYGKLFQKAVDVANKGIADELYRLEFQRRQIPLIENNLVAMREELAAIDAQGWMKDSTETRLRGDQLRRDIPLREREVGDLRRTVAELETVTRDAPRMPDDMGAWFSTYLMNPTAASLDPFTDAFESALDIQDPVMLGKIEGAQQSISAYAKAHPTEVMTAMIVPSDKPDRWDRLTQDADRFGWKIALGMRVSDMYAAVYANDHPFYLMTMELLRLTAKNTGSKIDLKAVDNPTKTWRIAAMARAWANRDLDKGIRFADAVDHSGPSMMDVLTTALGPSRRKAVDVGPGSRYRDFGAYLMARMGAERWRKYEAAKAAGELGQLREPYAVPKSVMIQAVQDLEVKYPSFPVAAEMLYQFQNNLLTLQWQKDLITEEQYRALLEEKNYVPSLRSFEDEQQLTGASGKKGEAALQDVIKRFKGSQRDVIDPIASIALKVFKTRADIAVNDTIKKLLYLAEQAGPGGGLFVERLDPRQAQAFRVDLRQALGNAAKEANLSDNDRAALVDLASEMLGSNVTTTMFTQGILRAGKGEPIIYMRENGSIVPLRLGKMGEGGNASARLGQQVWELLNTYGETHTNFVLQMMALPAQGLRSVIVSHPSFMLANILRDAPAAWGYDPQALPLWTQLVGSFDVLRGADYVERYRSTAGMMGGEATQLFDQFVADHDVETLVRKGYRFASFTSFENGLSFLSDAFSLKQWPDKAFGAGMGGIAGFAVGGPVGGVAGSMIGGALGGKAIAAFGELTETGTRSRLWKHAYDRGIAAGLSDVEAAAEAAFWAHDYGDYSRHGMKTDIIRRWVPFLNANLQANDSFFRRLLAKGDYGFEATKYVPGQVLLWPLYKAGVLQLPDTLTAKQREEIAMSAWTWFQTMAVIGSASMVYALMYRDDERIAMLPESLRANHWNIPLDDLARAIGAELPKEHRGKHFARIPKPFERAVFANTIERLTMEYARGNPRWFEHWLSDLYEVTKPPLMPTALDIPAQLLMNRDSFSGREIVPKMGSGQRMRSEMYDEYTSQFARWMGGTLDIAPQQVDFIISKLGSTWGRDATRANIPGAPWYDPKAATQGLDEKFIASRFLYKIGKGTEAEKAFREVMGGEDPLPKIWEKVTIPYNRLNANAESYKYLKDRLRQDAKALAKLDGMTPAERGYALLEGHWQGANAKYQLLHPMKRAETVSQLVSQMQKELIGDHAAAGKKGPRQTILDLSPTEKQAARDVLVQYKAMEAFNALVLTGEKGWQNRKYLPAAAVLEELKIAVPEVHAEFVRRLDKAHVAPFDGIKDTWPRVKEKLESQELLRRVKDKDTIGLGALLAPDYSEAKFR